MHRSRGGRTHILDLISICKRCHGLVHDPAEYVDPTARLLLVPPRRAALRGRRAFADRAAVDHVFERVGYDADGLEPAERPYLRVLRRSPVPISLTRLAR